MCPKFLLQTAYHQGLINMETPDASRRPYRQYLYKLHIILLKNITKLGKMNYIRYESKFPADMLLTIKNLLAYSEKTNKHEKTTE